MRQFASDVGLDGRCRGCEHVPTAGHYHQFEVAGSLVFRCGSRNATYEGLMALGYGAELSYAAVTPWSHNWRQHYAEARFAPSVNLDDWLDDWWAERCTFCQASWPGPGPGVMAHFVPWHDPRHAAGRIIHRCQARPAAPEAELAEALAWARVAGTDREPFVAKIHLIGQRCPGFVACDRVTNNPAVVTCTYCQGAGAVAPAPSPPPAPAPIIYCEAAPPRAAVRPPQVYSARMKVEWERHDHYARTVATPVATRPDERVAPTTPDRYGGLVMRLRPQDTPVRCALCGGWMREIMP